MKKTIIAILSVFSVFSFGITAGAVTRGNNITNGVGNMVEGVVEGAESVVRGAGDAVGGVVGGAGDVVEGVVGGTGPTAPIVNGATVNGTENNVNEVVREDERLNANTRTDLPNDKTTETEIIDERRERNPSTGVPVAGFVTVGAVALGTAVAAAVSKKRK